MLSTLINYLKTLGVLMRRRAVSDYGLRTEIGRQKGRVAEGLGSRRAGVLIPRPSLGLLTSC